MRSKKRGPLKIWAIVSGKVEAKFCVIHAGAYRRMMLKTWQDYKGVPGYRFIRLVEA